MIEEEIDWSCPFQKGNMKSSLLEVSSFAVLFPKVQEKLDTLEIKATLDTTDGVMGVSTTDKTWDPVAILK